MEEIRAVFRLTGPDIQPTPIIVTREGIYIGRVAGNDLVLQDSQISRRHLRIVWQDNSFWVEDLGSSNGVWLNNQRIDPRLMRVLQQGDEIRVGSYTLKFEQLENVGPSASVIIARPVPAPLPGIGETPGTQRAASTTGSHNGASTRQQPVALRENRSLTGQVYGIPEDQSNWLRYLPAIFSDPDLDPTLFAGRYLLIVESILNPIIWMIDNFAMYLTPETAPAEWLQWLAGWFDLLLVEDLPEERQRAIVREISWLFMRRGTCPALERLLELYLGVKPEIDENIPRPCMFTVRLPASQMQPQFAPALIERLIAAHTPAFATFRLELV